MLGGNLRRTSIPSRGSRNTPSRFILRKPEISAGADEPSGSPNYDCCLESTHCCITRVRISILLCGSVFDLDVVLIVAFAFVPETIRHLTDNYEYWRRAAEELVRLVFSLIVYSLVLFVCLLLLFRN